MSIPARKSVRFKIDPRMISPEKVARRLGVTLPIFEEKLPKLLAVGFPKAEPITGNYVLDAVDRWIDRIGGLEAHIQAEAELMAHIATRPWRKGPRKED